MEKRNSVLIMLCILIFTSCNNKINIIYYEIPEPVIKDIQSKLNSKEKLSLVILQNNSNSFSSDFYTFLIDTNYTTFFNSYTNRYIKYNNSLLPVILYSDFEFGNISNDEKFSSKIKNLKGVRIHFDNFNYVIKRDSIKCVFH
jgi:hypothetical protein